MADVSDQIVDLMSEAGLLQGHDAMVQSGFSEQQVKDMSTLILNADDPKEAMAEIDSKIADQVREAELQRLVEQLPQVGRDEEIQRIANVYGIPVANARTCVDLAEAHDRLMGPENPFRS